MQNRSHIKYLRALIGEQIPIHSVIVFSERCTLKNVTMKSKEIKVIKRNQVSFVVADICKSVSENIMTEENIVNLYNKLYPYTQISEIEKIQHIVNIQNKFTAKTNLISDETDFINSVSSSSFVKPIAEPNEPLKEQLNNNNIDLMENVEANHRSGQKESEKTSKETNIFNSYK